jgi:hypothetical protein
MKKRAFAQTGFAAVLLAAGSAVLVCGCSILRPQADAVRGITLVNGICDADGDAFRGAGASQIQFWTPSTATWEAVVASYDEASAVPPEDAWQRVTREQIDAFGRKLRESGLVDGWRYHEVYGYGEYTHKPGLWWTATTRDGIAPAAFGAFYFKCWPGSDRVYMELWLPR